LGLVAFVLVTAWLDSWIRQSLFREVARSSSWFIEARIQSTLQELKTRSSLSDEATNALSSLLQQETFGRKLLDIKVWSPYRRILFSSHAHEIGTNPRSTPELDGALAGNVTAELDDRDDQESSPQRSGGKRILEVYFPVRALDTEKTIAIAELYLDAADLVDELWSARWQTVVITGFMAAAFMLAVFLIVRHGGGVISGQRREIDQKGKTQTKLVVQNNQLARRVLEAQHRNIELTDQILRHVGSDLHDGPAQLLSVALLRLGEISFEGADADRNQRDRERIEAARHMTQDALSEIRHIAKGLVLPQLEELRTADAVKLAVADHKKRTRTEVTLELDLQGRDFPLAVKKCLFRCIQEGLNNAFRHAGGREQFVSVAAENSRVVLTIKDAGPGLSRRAHSRKRSGLGLAGLRKRVEVLGGQFDISSSVGMGTSIKVELPLVDST